MHWRIQWPWMAGTLVCVIALLIMAIIIADEKNKYCEDIAERCNYTRGDDCTVVKLKSNITCDINCDQLPGGYPDSTLAFEDDCYYDEVIECYSADCTYTSSLFNAAMIAIVILLAWTVVPFILIGILVCIFKEENPPLPTIEWGRRNSYNINGDGSGDSNSNSSSDSDESGSIDDSDSSDSDNIGDDDDSSDSDTTSSDTALSFVASSSSQSSLSDTSSNTSSSNIPLSFDELPSYDSD